MVMWLQQENVSLPLGVFKDSSVFQQVLMLVGDYRAKKSLDALVVSKYGRAHNASTYRCQKRPHLLEQSF